MIKKKFIDVLKYLLLLNLSFFLAFGIYEERITKVCFVLGFILYLSLKFLEEGKILKKIIEFTQINKLIFIFLAICFLSIFFGINPKHSQEVFFQRYLPYFILFFIAVYLSKDKKNTRILIFSLLLGAFIVSVGGIIDIFKAKRFIRLFSSYGINCLYADYFLYTLPFFVCLSLFHPSRKIKILSISLSIPSFVCFFFHYSRGAWLGFLFAYLIIFFIIREHRRFIMFVILFVAIITFFSPLRRRLFSYGTLHPYTWGDRVTMWKAGLRIFKKYPLLGAGIGNYELLMYKVVNPEEYREGGIHLHAHNTYLEVLAETGILGFLSFLSIFGIFFKNKFKKLRKKRDPANLSLSVAILAVLIADLAGSTILVGIHPPSMFWFLFGLANSN
ncbi:MAG: O-antigen ligase family protein [Thermodesulfobacterium sp.]|nr:O-antigen ligase family protein [Thermodesulfobacterium sp.]